MPTVKNSSKERRNCSFEVAKEQRNDAGFLIAPNDNYVAQHACVARGVQSCDITVLENNSKSLILQRCKYIFDMKSTLFANLLNSLYRTCVMSTISSLAIFCAINKHLYKK